MRFSSFRSIVLLSFLMLYSLTIVSQVDSSYIQPFDQQFSSKIYFSDGFSAFNKENDKDESQDYTYRTNKPASVGLGIAWEGFSVSFSRGFDFLRDKAKGKTESLEFQHHGYLRKFAYDIFLAQHKGFYNEIPNKDGTYTTYPDVDLKMYGGSFQYVFNNKKFSYKAAFSQSEVQMKSAGSFLLGTTLYYSRVKSDTTLLMAKMNQNQENLQIGVVSGYAYTWVANKYIYLTGSIEAGGTMGNNHPRKFFKNRMRIYPTMGGRFAFGYNINSWSAGFSAHLNRVYLFFDGQENLSMNNATMQLSLIKRFHWGKADEGLSKTKKKLRLEKFF